MANFDSLLGLVIGFQSVMFAPNFTVKKYMNFLGHFLKSLQKKAQNLESFLNCNISFCLDRGKIFLGHKLAAPALEYTLIFKKKRSPSMAKLQ
jgi:hypothetical protein